MTTVMPPSSSTRSCLLILLLRYVGPCLCPFHLSNALSQIPPNLTFDQASSVSVTLLTAVLGLYNTKENGGLGFDAPWKKGGRGKYAAEPILIIGGASSVGQYGTSLFPHLSLRIIKG